MTPQEALVFLELEATASAAEIKTRLAERLAHYETLSEKAPSDFLRRLHLRNLTKVKTILQESVQWPSFTTPPETVPPETSTEPVAEEPALTIHIVPSVKDAAKKKAADQPAGWLIMHTENQHAKSFALQAGKNFLGRKLHASLTPFIVIEGDDYISRLQCVVYAEEATGFEFYISDPSTFNNGKTSSNGTFINGSNQPVTQKVKLANGDTIQTGITKLVLKYNTGDLTALVKEVEQSKYTDTVLLN
jgi:hypothetical protein